jgi:hypothetical protein
VTLTVEERLRGYATTLDEAITAHRGPSARLDSLAPLDLPDGPRPGARLRHVLVGVAAVGVLVATLTVIVDRQDRGPATTASTARMMPTRGDRSIVLFTRTVPTGIVFVARAGMVPVAETLGCPVVPVPAHRPPSPDCPRSRAHGVQFDYTVARHTYRITVLDRARRRATAPALEPVATLAMTREVFANGASVPWSGARLPAEMAVLHATGLAKVRVNPTRTTQRGFDEMAPIDGWAVFVNRAATADSTFDLRVEGVDAAGRVVTTALPWRCC